MKEIPTDGRGSVSQHLINTSYCFAGQAIRRECFQVDANTSKYPSSQFASVASEVARKWRDHLAACEPCRAAYDADKVNASR
jgi:hypothetical protein